MSQPIVCDTIDPARNGNASAPLIVLGPSLGTTDGLWAGVIPRLAETHRVLRFDLPGHGRSPSVTESFTLEEVADAVVDRVDSLGVRTFHYAGVSLGGAIGLALAVNRPERVASLAMFCSGAKIGTHEAWNNRAKIVRARGTSALRAGSAARWFAPSFLGRDPQAGANALDELLDIDDESYALACEALADFDQTDAVSGIRVPVLCVSGEYDTVTPTAQLRALAAEIPGAEATVVAGSAHLPSLERPAEVGRLLVDWVARATRSISRSNDGLDSLDSTALRASKGYPRHG